MFELLFQVCCVLFIGYFFVPLDLLKILSVMILPILFGSTKLQLNFLFLICHFSQFLIHFFHLFMRCSVHFLDCFPIHLSLSDFILCTQLSITSHEHKRLHIFWHKLKELLKIVLYKTKTFNYWQNIICKLIKRFLQILCSIQIILVYCYRQLFNLTFLLFFQFNLNKLTCCFIIFLRYV